MVNSSRRIFFKTLGAIIGSLFIYPIILKAKSPLYASKTNQKMPANTIEPSYLKLHRSGELKKRASTLWEIMNDCTLCPRECRVNRVKGEKGVCNSSSSLQISSFNPHFGEESFLVGSKGSGTIFFTSCSLLCVFCINWEISHGGQGRVRTIEDLANMMLSLQRIGCHNINVVTPTHYSPHIVAAIDLAAGKGLMLPIAYNTCSWEKIEVLRLLDGIIDIYLADYKYSNPSMAGKLSPGAFSYPKVTQNALVEMNRQVGVAMPNKEGILERGLIIRHLVMPNDASGSVDVMRWIANNLPKNTYINIMSQYTPTFKAFDYPEIARRISKEEYAKVVNAAKSFGLDNLDIQGKGFLVP